MHAGFVPARKPRTRHRFCLTTYTVGSLPCTSAAALAKTEGLPVVFISGAPGEDEVHQASIHHMVQPGDSWRTEYDAAHCAFAALGLRAERLQRRPRRGPAHISAFRFYELVKHAWLHREPVFIEVPRNLVFALTQPLALPAVAQLHSGDSVCRAAGGSGQHHPEVQGCKKKTFGVLACRCAPQPALIALMVAFCQRFNIPYANHWFAKGGVDETHPLCLGG